MKSEVFNIDCLEYMRSLPDKYFHIAIADPPYGNGGSAGGYKDGRFGGGNTARFYKYRKAVADNSLAVGWDMAPSSAFFNELFRVSQHQVIWGANYFTLPPCKCFLTWVKTNIPERFSMAQAECAWTSFECNAKVFHCSSARSKDGKHFHPTEKPVQLYHWCLSVWLESLRNKEHPLRMFDPMMGSQSSRIAAYMFGLDYYGCELDAEYFRLGCERYDKDVRNITPTKTNEYRQLYLF